jgi:hypothetical protein
MMTTPIVLLPAVEEECYWAVKGTAADTEAGLKTDVDTDDAHQMLPVALDNQQSTAEMKMSVAVKKTDYDTEEAEQKSDTEETEWKTDTEEAEQKTDAEEAEQKSDAEEAEQKTDAEEAGQKNDDNHAAVGGTLMKLHQTTMEAKMKPTHLWGPDSMEQILLPLLDKTVPD